MIVFLEKEKDLEKEIKSSKNVVLYLYADWCPPCQMMTTPIKLLSSENNDVKFIKIDVDAFPKISQEWGLKQIPTTVFLLNGKEVDRREGLLNKMDFQKIIFDKLN